MTRNAFFNILSVLIVLISSSKAFAGNTGVFSKTVHTARQIKMVPPMASKQSATTEETGGLPARTESSLEKHQKPASEELAHIHHFHKERVKKIKRHHKKYWVLSKFILILCHLALLVIAYLHLTH